MKKECNHCGYVWDYTGKMTLYANCPDCRKAVRLIEEGEIKTSPPFNDSKEEDLKGE